MAFVYFRAPGTSSNQFGAQTDDCALLFILSDVSDHVPKIFIFHASPTSVLVCPITETSLCLPSHTEALYAKFSSIFSEDFLGGKYP